MSRKTRRGQSARQRAHARVPLYVPPAIEHRGVGIGSAVSALKAGYRVCRAGWNGRGMWLSYTPGNVIHADKFWSQHNRQYAAEQLGQMAAVLAYITLKTSDGSIVPWLCSQTDLLAEDWLILPD